jgi:hypothetical protein
MKEENKHLRNSLNNPVVFTRESEAEQYGLGYEKSSF